MQQLNNLLTISRNTIADGDNLNTIVTACSANDASILAASVEDNTKITDVRNTVSTHSASWDNSILRNFKQVKSGNSVINGKSKMNETFTIATDNSLKFVKNENNTYSLELSEVGSVASSWYMDNAFAFPLFDNDILGHCLHWVGSMVDGSTLLYTTFISANGGPINGFLGVMAENLKDTPTTRSATQANIDKYGCYSGTVTSMMTEDGTIVNFLQPSYPTRCSILYNTNTQYIGNTQLSDNNSISLYEKNSAFDYSICLKGGIAKSRSIAYGIDSNYSTSVFPVLVGYAENDSIALQGASASNKSIAIATNRSYSTNIETISAMDHSMCVFGDGGNFYANHSAINLCVNLPNTLNNDNSLALAYPASTHTVNLKNKSVVVGASYYNGTTQKSGTIDIDRSVVIASDEKQSNYKIENSVVINMKGYNGNNGFTAKNSVLINTKSCSEDFSDSLSINTDVGSNGSKFDKVKNSVLIGASPELIGDKTSKQLPVPKLAMPGFRYDDNDNVYIGRGPSTACAPALYNSRKNLFSCIYDGTLSSNAAYCVSIKGGLGPNVKDSMSLGNANATIDGRCRCTWLERSVFEP